MSSQRVSHGCGGRYIDVSLADDAWMASLVFPDQRHGQSSQSQSTQSQQQHEHEQGRTRSQQSTYEQPSQSHQTQSSRYSQAHEFEKPHQPPAQPDASPQREQSRMASQQAEESAPSNGAKQNENLAEKELSALEAFLKRTRDDLKEAERRASERE